jgi:hypothetical protein
MDLHYKKTDYFMPYGEINIACKNIQKITKYCVGSMPSYDGEASGTYSNHCALKG